LAEHHRKRRKYHDRITKKDEGRLAACRVPMIEKSKEIEPKILTPIFFILLLTAIFLVAKASLTALGIYSSTTYSVAYFLLFGAGYIFTKYVYYSMYRIYQYVALAVTTAISGLCILWLQYLH